jgi:hypothetical protein
MITELDKAFQCSDMHKNKLVELSTEFFRITGWDQYTFEQSLVAVMDTLDDTKRDFYVPFLHIIEEGIYTTTTIQDFAHFIVSCCEDSYTAVRSMCIILEIALEKLHMILAI